MNAYPTPKLLPYTRQSLRVKKRLRNFSRLGWKMESSTMVSNGGIKLPIGYRFHPTDEELVVHYLKRKVHFVPLPAQVIPELDIFQTNPWDLPGDSREKRYFFNKRKGNWKKRRGMTESGYWKPMGKERHVVGFDSNQVIGVKKTLVFYQGRRPRGARTQWVMHEYRLVGSRTTPPNYSVHQKFVRRRREMEGDWVVCKIKQKKRKPEKQKSYSIRIWNAAEIIVEDHNNGDSGPPRQYSSSCSSGITTDEISCSNGAVDQEETSGYIF